MSAVVTDQRESHAQGGSPQARPAYRPQIDGIRALAVLAVVFFHLGFGWIPGGFIGVDIFFVLSGYLISGLLISEAERRGSVHLPRFYARRARRLLPAAWVVIVFSVVVGRLVSAPIEYENLHRHATSAALYVANWDWATVNRGYFSTDREPSPVIHFWSLAVEEQFYLVWPALVVVCLLLARRTRGPLLAILAAAFALITVASIALAVTLTPSSAAYYGTHTRAFELSAGGLLALLMTRREARPIGSRRQPSRADAVVRLALTITGLGGLVWLMGTVTGSTAYPGWTAVGVTVFSVLLIAGVDLADQAIPARVAGSAGPMWVGKLSYSIYLWHWPLIVFLAPYLNVYEIAALTLAVSAVSYFVLEQPIRRRLFPTVAFWKIAATGLACSLAIGLLLVPAMLHNTPLESEAAAARHDVARPPSDCHFSFPSWPSAAQSDACLVNDGTGPTVLLVGDSHAQMWAPAVAKVAEQNNWHLISVTRSKCTPADFTIARSVDKPGQPTIGEECTQWRHGLYPKVIDTYQPDFVIVGSRSQIYNIRDGSRVVTQHDPAFAELWRTAWLRSIRTFSASGARVVLLAPVPSLPNSMVGCVAESVGGCSYDATDDGQTVRATSTLEGIADSDDNVEWVDVASLVCPSWTCPGRIDGMIVHQDRSHVTATFAAAQAAAIGSMLKAVGLPVAS